MTETGPENPFEGKTPEQLLGIGIDLHNEHRFFEAHEAWEAVWMDAPNELRNFYQGLIQITAAFVHITRKEFPGAYSLMEDGLTSISSYQPDFLGVATDRFLNDAMTALHSISNLGPDNIANFNLDEAPRVTMLLAGESRSLGTPDRVLHYLDWASAGKPAVVLIHGANEMARLWLPVAAKLQPHFRVLAPDLPGHGASADREPGVAPAVDAISAWVAAMAPDAVVIVGNGASGGAIAAAVAADAGVQAVVFGPAEGEEWPPEPAPLEVREWSNYWDLFFDLRISKPYSGWRPDVFWWLVEHGVVETADVVKLRVSLETEQALRNEARPAGPYQALAAAPFTRPHVAAKQLRELLQGLA